MSAPAEPAGVVHVYDDIREEDNHLPHWWLAILFGAIVFAFGYWFVFEVAHAAPSPLELFRAEAAAAEKRKAEAGPITDEALAVLAKDGTTVADGKKTFVSTCAPCHGLEGQGIIGPNLTDGFWLHGGKPIDIHASITAGYPDKGMRPWGPVLGAARVRAVAAFVVSIKGQNLAGRPPQGTPEN
jgi:cytochrome c oxidase cbb3-type subunit 3